MRSPSGRVRGEVTPGNFPHSGRLPPPGPSLPPPPSPGPTDGTQRHGAGRARGSGGSAGRWARAAPAVPWRAPHSQLRALLLSLGCPRSPLPAILPSSAPSGRCASPPAPLTEGPTSGGGLPSAGPSEVPLGRSPTSTVPAHPPPPPLLQAGAPFSAVTSARLPSCMQSASFRLHIPTALRRSPASPPPHLRRSSYPSL